MGRKDESILRWSSDFLPELCAEDIPFYKAEEEMLRHNMRRNPEGVFLSAWNHVEFAMNRSRLDQEVRDNYFDLSQHLLLRAFNNPLAHQNTQLSCLLLSSYIPLFRKRANETIPTAEDCWGIYESIGQAMAYVRPLSVDQPPQWEMMETAVLALSARTMQPDLLLYPASPREEGSPFLWSNHDSYFYSDSRKVPIQQKLIQTDKEYADWMTILTILPIVDKAFKRTGLDTELSSHKINYLMSLIVAETSELEVTENERKLLNHMSSAVVSHRQAGMAKTPSRAA